MTAHMWRYFTVFSLLGGTFIVNTYENSTDDYAPWNSTVSGLSGNNSLKTTPSVPTSIDDFIIIDMYGYAKLRQQGLMPKGLFGTHGMWFVGKDGTNYLLVGKSGVQEKKDWEDALENSTASTVCVDSVCLDRESAQKRIESVGAYVGNILLPGYVTPFAIMVSFFIVAGVVGISGMYDFLRFFWHTNISKYYTKDSSYK